MVQTLVVIQVTIRGIRWPRRDWAVPKNIILSVCRRGWSSAGVSSPMELRSLKRVYGRRTVVQAASPPSPHGQWIQGNDECRYCLGTNSVAGVAGLALSGQNAFGTLAPAFLLWFTPLGFPRTGRPQDSSDVIS